MDGEDAVWPQIQTERRGKMEQSRGVNVVGDLQARSNTDRFLQEQAVEENSRQLEAGTGCVAMDYVHKAEGTPPGKKRRR